MIETVTGTASPSRRATHRIGWAGRLGVAVASFALVGSSAGVAFADEGQAAPHGSADNGVTAVRTFGGINCAPQPVRIYSKAGGGSYIVHSWTYSGASNYRQYNSSLAVDRAHLATDRGGAVLRSISGGSIYTNGIIAYGGRHCD